MPTRPWSELRDRFLATLTPEQRAEREARMVQRLAELRAAQARERETAGEPASPLGNP